MIDVISTMQVLLREAHFTTRLTSIDRSPIVCFEDDTLMGFGCIFESPRDLLTRWKATEMSLLARHAGNFRVAGDKAWNVYCVFLCSSVADSVENRQVGWIEEDLQRTRKIAGCGLENREDLIRLLLPVLPLRYQPEVEPEDLTQRLQRRIRTIAPAAAEVVLDEAVPVNDIVRLLGGPA